VENTIRVTIRPSLKSVRIWKCLRIVFSTRCHKITSSWKISVFGKILDVHLLLFVMNKTCWYFSFRKNRLVLNAFKLCKTLLLRCTFSFQMIFKGRILNFIIIIVSSGTFIGHCSLFRNTYCIDLKFLTVILILYFYFVTWGYASSFLLLFWKTSLLLCGFRRGV